MKTKINVEPLCRYVTQEVSPFYLMECIHELTTDYIRLLWAEVERNEPSLDVLPCTYNRLFELQRIHSCLLEGLRMQLEPGEIGPGRKGNVSGTAETPDTAQ